MAELSWIRDLIGVMRDAPVAELEVERDGYRVTIRRGAATGTAPSLAPAAAVDRPAAPTPSAEAAVDYAVTTPDHGVFHRAAAPGGAPFVAEGQQVEAGQPLGVIEAMKVFSPILAPVAGRVVEIGAADGAEVESGACLFRLR